MVMAQNGQGCIYTYREDGIHEFVFTGEDGGVDTFFALLEEILRTAPKDRTLRYIIDISGSQGKAPMRELLQRFRRLEANIPERAPGRTAIVHNPSLFASLADTLVGTFAPGEDKTRFFPQARRAEALAWLATVD